MKTRLITSYLLLLSFAFHNLMAQEIQCGTANAMQEFFEQNPEALEEALNYNDQNRNLSQDPCDQHYVIPVVFHVYHDGGASAVTQGQIQSALDRANDDFNGLNGDFNTIDPAFDGIKSTLDITFTLAQIDPMGNSTTGINYYAEACGFGNGNAGFTVSLSAWDNYKYMNIYIMEDLYCDGVTNNSGVAWYPNTFMSDNNSARVVYNHLYLGNQGTSIAGVEFQSVITHEFGHFLNLRHTFDDGCSGDGDGVADTPTTIGSAGCGPNAMSCGHITNGENYMDYNSSCYKMFTEGQIARMIAGLNHPARITLWQESNLIATGTIDAWNGGNTNGAPIADFSQDNTTITLGESVTFTDLSCNDPNAWNWTFQNGSPASASIQNPTITYNVPGVHQVTFSSSNANGNSNTVTGQVTVENINTSTNNLINTDHLNAYVWSDQLLIQAEAVEVFDATGRLIINKTNQKTIDLYHLNQGVYLVRLWDGEIQKTIKVIK